MEDLTRGSIVGHLVKTTSFMLVTMVFQTLYFLVDLYWVGRLGKEAIAGVGIAGNLTFLVLAITQMLVGGLGMPTEETMPRVGKVSPSAISCARIDTIASS